MSVRNPQPHLRRPPALPGAYRLSKLKITQTRQVQEFEALAAGENPFPLYLTQDEADGRYSQIP